MISFLESCAVNFQLPQQTRSLPVHVLVVIKIAEAISSCSAWDKRSAATYLGLAVSSARY